jgi:hypothetical protein
LSPSTVEEGFKELLGRIELNPARVTLASQRYNAVKQTIEAALSGKTVRQVGSFQRKTRIRPTDLSDGLDVDGIVSFGKFYEYAASGSGISPQAALETVRRALVSDKTYQVMTPVTSHPVLRLEYADEMAIELVPVYEDATGTHPHKGSITCYIFGKSPHWWAPCDYEYDAAVISALNVACDNQLVPTVKMMKAYFREREVPLKSFHTELLVASTLPSFIPQWKAAGYTFGYHHIVAEFLDRASQIVTGPVQISGSYTIPVDSGLEQTTMIRIAVFLAGRAKAAWALCKTRDQREALSGWRQFLGDPFPF